jgi:autotransporter-associated beta strand protein
VAIGTVNMAVNTSAGGTVLADLNVTGGNVTLGTGSGTAVNMANAGSGRTVTSNVNLTGGTITVTGDIVRTGGLGTENATITLNGSTLNLSGNDIGTGAATVNLVAQSGTLAGLAELNGGGALTKTTTGILIMGAANNYTGATNVSDGTLQVGVAGVGTTGTGMITVVKTGATYANAPVLSGSGTIAGATVIGDISASANKGILAPGDSGSITNQTLTFTPVSSVTVYSGSQVQMGISSATGTDLAFASYSGNAASYLASLLSTGDGVMGSAPAAWFTAPASNEVDHLALGGGNLTLGTNSGGAAANEGIMSVFSNGLVLGSLANGQIFNLIDWTGIYAGLFNAGSGISTGGIHGDFDLPDISSTSFGWDTSAFVSHGVLAIVAVPEPSRLMLLFFGLFGLCFRRRR